MMAGGVEWARTGTVKLFFRVGSIAGCVEELTSRLRGNLNGKMRSEILVVVDSQISKGGMSFGKWSHARPVITSFITRSRCTVLKFLLMLDAKYRGRNFSPIVNGKHNSNFEVNFYVGETYSLIFYDMPPKSRYYRIATAREDSLCINGVFKKMST